MFVVLIGPPGAGKGTQSKLICQQYGIPHVSTGELLRQAIASGDSLGQSAKHYIDRGGLVPDPIILRLISEQLKLPEIAKGCLFDGFPRTIIQAEALDEALAETGHRLHAALEFRISTTEMVKRLSGRFRADDRPEVIERRVEAYLQLTEPLLEYYRLRGLLRSIDAMGAKDEVFGRIRAALDGPP